MRFVPLSILFIGIVAAIAVGVFLTMIFGGLFGTKNINENENENDNKNINDIVNELKQKQNQSTFVIIFNNNTVEILE